ncbi:MAG: DUF4396 domain-containing protein [Hyphomicrobiaceae bacterium]
MIPPWLHSLAIFLLAIGFVSALAILADIGRHPQQMAIMNVVWPITGLYAGPLAVWGYLTYGRTVPVDAENTSPARCDHYKRAHKSPVPFPAKVGKGAMHCGAGCTLGDIIAEWLAFLVPAIALWFGYRSMFSEKIFAIWILDYVLALLFGIGFQYASIVPMRHLSPGRGIVEAAKADILSLSSWQIGMYGFMAIVHFGLFGAILGTPLEVDMPEFWASMQLAMIAGFITAYPMNWWLIRKGIKEAM